MYVGPETNEIYVFSQQNLNFEGALVTQAFSSETNLTVLSVPPRQEVPIFDELQLTVRDAPMPPENTWIPIGNEAFPLELHNVGPGTVWLRAYANITNPNTNGHFYVEHASDIVGIFVNNHYITTVCPVGTEIDNQSLNSNYSFDDLRLYLREGDNEVLFRIEVWGHGSFMWPRGRIIATSAQIPSLGFDAFKGILGTTQLAGHNLMQWEMNIGSVGERLGWHRADSIEGFQHTVLPVMFEKGQTRWIRVSLPAKAIQFRGWRPPLAISLRGKNLVGTIWLNGHLIGRWLSDEDFLQRGAWTRALRNMWMNTSPDSFPLPNSCLDPNSENMIAIELQDVSGTSDTTGGTLDELKLQFFPEEKSLIDNTVHLVSRPLFMFPLSIIAP